MLEKTVLLRVSICEADLAAKGLECGGLSPANYEERACNPDRFCSSDGGIKESIQELEKCGLETLKPFWSSILAPFEIGGAVATDVFNSIWLCSTKKNCGVPKLAAEELRAIAIERDQFNSEMIAQEKLEEANLCSEMHKGFDCPLPNISCREWDDVLQGKPIVTGGVTYTSTSVRAEEGFNKGNFCKEALKRSASARDALRDSSVRKATEGFTLYLKDLLTPWACLQPKFAAQRFCRLRGEVLSSALLPLAMTRALRWASEGKSALEIGTLLRKAAEDSSAVPNSVTSRNITANAASLKTKLAGNLERRGLLSSHDGNPVRKFSKDEISNVSLFKKGSTTGLQYEGGAVQRGPNLELNRTVEALERENGEVRSLVKENFSLINKSSVDNLSYFRTASDGTPVLVLEKGASSAVIAHEMEHFNDWLLVKKKFISEGFNEKEARLKAGKYLVSKDPEIIRGMESRAVAVQNRISGLQLASPEVIERITYPERTAVFRAITRAELEKRALTPKEMAEANKYAEIALVKAIKTRELRDIGSAAVIENQSLLPPTSAPIGERKIFEEMGIQSDSKIYKIFSDRLPVVEALLRKRE